MYVVGFYSPKEKSGVTETSLAVFRYLQNLNDFSVAFVSNEILEKEPINNETAHKFANLTLNEQKKKIGELKSKFDIVIYDASSKLNEEVLKLLPIVNRLFVIGDDNVVFTENLYKILDFNKHFDNKSRNLINQLNNRGAYVLNSPNHNIGFTNPKKGIENICKMIHNDFLNYTLEKTYLDKHNSLVKKIKKVPLENLAYESNKMGVEFDKSLLFSKYVQLRYVCGQEIDKAIEDIFPLIVHYSYQEIYHQFQNEMNIAQISFQKKE